MDVYAGILEGIRAGRGTSVSLEAHLQTLKTHVRFLRKAYYGKPVVVPYEKTEIQEAYLITYFPHYYQLIYSVFFEKVPDFFKTKKAVTCSFIGGGPGSEIYGLMRYISRNAKHVKKIEINLFDINANTWKYSHDLIDISLIKKMLGEDIEFTWTSHQLDITKTEMVLKYQKQFISSDLVVVQNCLNEISNSLIGKTNKNIVQIFEWLGPGSLLLLSDMTSGARDVLKAIEKNILEKFTPVFHKTTLNNSNSESLISRESLPPLLIRKNLLTGDDGLIPRKYIKYDYSIIGKIDKVSEPEIKALGFNALYGPLNFSYLDANDNASSKVFIGIDFGTSTTAISAAYINDGKLEIEPLSIAQKGKDGSIKLERLTPCVVSKVGNKLLVGYYAALYKRSLTYGVDCWHSFKANLGNLESIHYAESELKHDARFKISGMKDAFALYLKYLHREVSRIISERFPDKEPMYALSVPVDFGSAEKRQLKKMMSEAGFECTDVPLIEEPNAALINYFFAANTAVDQGKPLKSLVFDIGAGTVDLSIVEVENQDDNISSKLLAVHRDGQLGGDWIDTGIANRILESSLPGSIMPAEQFQSLQAFCEQLKILMCKSLHTDRTVDFKLDDNSESDVIVSIPDPFEVETGRKILVGLTYKSLSNIMQEYWVGNDEFKGVANSLMDCLQIASLKPNEIDKVIITGGGGRNPYIKTYLSRLFGADKLFFVDDIQEQVARGAALHSFFINSFGKPVITSLLSENYYIEVDGDRKKVFSKGDSYPTYDIDFFYTTVKLKDSKIYVYKSESFVLNKTFFIPDPGKVKQLVFFIDPDQELRCEIVTDSNALLAEETGD